MMFGFCALVGDAINLIFIAGPMLGLYLLKVRDEERCLAERFPDDWPGFREQTPRFIPRRLWAAGTADWNLSQWLGASEYRAVIGTAAALVALKIWRVL